MSILLSKKAILKSEDSICFNNKKCILTISVGQLNHEADKLFSTILAINKHFSYCIIMVCDSLQRYTMRIFSEKNSEELHKISNQFGDDWISRNIESINSFTIPYKISRWDDWINHPDFKEKLFIINQLHLNSTEFKDIVFFTAKTFLKRNTEKIACKEEEAIELSSLYLLEECAVMLLLAEEGYHFEIYPSERNAAMDYIYRTIISGVDRNLMRAVWIKFKSVSYNRKEAIESP